MTTVLGSTHEVEQLSLSMFPSILAFDFDLMLGSFFTFGALMGYFWGWGRVQKLFWGLLIETNNFCFLSFALFLLYHVVLSSWWVVVVGGWVVWCSQRLLSLNPTAVIVVLLLGLWLLLGCDNILPILTNPYHSNTDFSKNID